MNELKHFICCANYYNKLLLMQEKKENVTNKITGCQVNEQR